MGLHHLHTHPLNIAASALVASIAMSACQPHGGSTANPAARTLPPEAQLASLPLGDIAGVAKIDPPVELANPLAGNPAAIAEGRRLYVSMNCAGCHGYDAGGAMGPNLTDPLWRYGGTPAGIYKSIFEGRPQGMPAWGRALPAQNIWKIVAYLQTLGGAVEAQNYHAGLQGDHDVTSTAPAVYELSATFNQPRSLDK